MGLLTEGKRPHLKLPLLYWSTLILPMDLFIALLPFVLAGAIGYLIYRLIKVIRHEKQHPPARKLNYGYPPEMQQRLIRMAGNKKTAARLFNQTKRNNPDRSPSWCMEKTIWDLERDRRS